MWHSRTFWRCFLGYAILLVTATAFLSVLIGDRLQLHFDQQQVKDDPASRGLVREIEGLIWIVTGFASLGALALAFWLTREIVEPVAELTKGTERVAAGDYGGKVYTARRDELGTLSRQFNQMSERLAAQFAQLEEERRQLRAILSGMVEGVVALDAEQRILFANQRAAQLLEFQTSSAGGRKLWEVFRQRSLQDVVQRALSGLEPCQEELTWSGSGARSVLVHAAPLTDSPARGAVLVLHDISELRRLERLRQEFVANVSHELKTPLAVIKACVETLIDGGMDDHEHRGGFLEQINDQADRLNALILDLLSVARIESGTEVFDFQEVALDQVAALCLERHRPRAETKHQTLEAGPVESNGFPARAWADEEALGQIVDNLLDNAVKYTPDGGRISMRWWVDGEQARLEVKDSGIGIAERDLARIFERFYRVDKARSREMGGTGLGLSIVKHLVQAMGGNVRAASQLGQGTTFSISLPIAPH
jgi:two-component system phosphate regulon sensor histidine kinase PhoR